MAIINNVAYSWSMITLASTALGIEEGSTVLEGVSGIKWSKKRKIEPNYGLGGKPVSRGFGNISYTASITMDYATQQTLIFRLEMGIPFSFHSLAWDRFFLKRGGFVFAIRGYFGIFAAF